MQASNCRVPPDSASTYTLPLHMAWGLPEYSRGALGVCQVQAGACRNVAVPWCAFVQTEQKSASQPLESVR